MKARDLMTKDPACCTPETNLQMVAQMMVDHDCGELPVVESEQNLKLVGVITDRDIVCRVIAKAKNPLETKAGACMSPNPVSVNPDSSLEECLHIMEQHQIRRLPVVERGECVGIIAQADVARYDQEKASEVVRQVSGTAKARR